MADTNIKIKRSSKEITRAEAGIQIYLPLGIGIVLFMLIAVLVSTNVSPVNANIHHWANISVVLLAIPMFLLSLVVLALFVLLIVGQAKLLGWIPTQLGKVHAFFLKVALAIWKFSTKITSPIVTVKSKVSGFRNGLKR